MKIGDKVRFLNEAGGGRVTGFKGKNIVLVEDADGFEIPFAINDVVKVDDSDAETLGGIVTASNNTKPSPSQPASIPEPLHDDNEPIVVEERKGGEKLSVFLAFTPINIKELTKTEFETYIVNDCNYFIHYTYLTAENNNWTLRASGEIAPNTLTFVEEFHREKLNDFERICIQLIAYKRDKPFQLKNAISTTIRLDAVKFYKLHTFRENDFFDTPALIYPIIEEDKMAESLTIDKDLIRERMMQKTSQKDNSGYVRRYEKSGKQGNPFSPRHKNDDIIVVDLHAHELLETTQGMNNSDILNYQLDTFRRTLEENKGRKGQKIVFIHGKGEGVLRHALIHELNYKYKKYTYQDASFQEYGYGATQVTIR